MIKREDIILIGNTLTDVLLSESIVPIDFLQNISKVLPGDSKNILQLFKTIWDQKCNNSSHDIDINQPLILSRGFNINSTTDEQLATFLPEEKILINKEIFRGHLNGVDLTNINNQEQKELIDTLNQDSIGLSNNDVLLYYNLIKINQLVLNTNNNKQEQTSSIEYSNELYKLVTKNFNLTPTVLKKINGGKVLNNEAIVKLIANGINKKRINPQVLSLCLGHKNSKYFDFFIGFITFFISQRGDDVDEILCYIGLYILLNGATDKEIKLLDLGSNVEAFIKDRIGRVRSVYYVAMLFLHTFNVILTAQIYEISVKYLESPLDQRLKIEKLYSADNRRQILITNAMNIAKRKVSGFKNESLEVLSAFKRFYNSKYELVSPKDIFNKDYRSWK